eukprot:GHRR01002630.1.p1 GENE.GHRR01002630.1~~GHRR01002630.1.p1  ORF type:complete len:144 (+),score=73.72 GHRR01002630.1:50-433(+)
MQHPSPEMLPAIRLLMREMEVAVREEDYEAAARIRDHPWMRLAEDINMHRSIGYLDEAQKLMTDLEGMIKAHEAAMGREYEARQLQQQQQPRLSFDDIMRRQHQAEEQQQQPAQEEGSGVQQNEGNK